MTLQPPASLLCKLASIAVHAAEAKSANGHPADEAALASVLGDDEVVAWIAEMTMMGMAPVTRPVAVQ